MAIIAAALQSLASTSVNISTQGLNLLLQQTPIHDAPLTVIDQESKVILGAGVIGLSTAYHLAFSLNEYGAASSSLPLQLYC